MFTVFMIPCHGHQSENYATTTALADSLFEWVSTSLKCLYQAKKVSDYVYVG